MRRFASAKPFIVLCVIVLTHTGLNAQQRALTPEDIMKFKEMHHTTITPDGAWLAFTATPDRGDGCVRVLSVDGASAYTIDRGSRPALSSDGRWAAAALLPEATLKKEKQSPRGMALLSTASGELCSLPRVDGFQFSPDGHWLVVKKGQKAKGKEKKTAGQPMLLFSPGSVDTLALPYVTHFAFDSTSTWLACAVADSAGQGNGLYRIDLKTAPLKAVPVVQQAHYTVQDLAWYHASGRLAFTWATPDTGKTTPTASVWLWTAAKDRVAALIDNDLIDDAWTLPLKAAPRWSPDGKRLFVGLVRPEIESPTTEDDTTGVVNPFDREAILAGRGVDVWHWNDEYISPQQKKMWPRVKKKTYTAVYHLRSKKLIPLSDETLPSVRVSPHARHLLARSDKPYRKLLTWVGGFEDVYLVALKDGARIPVVKKLGGAVSYAPGGRFVVYFKEGHWHLFDVKKRATRSLTAELDVPFANEDHDYPMAVPGYGVAGWMKEDAAVLIYDKYDLWRFDTKSGAATCLTGGAGRQAQRTFRLVRTNPKAKTIAPNAPLLLSSYHQMEKNHGFYRLAPGGSPERLLETDHKYTFVKKAEKVDRYFYTREKYTEFPDLWTSTLDFADGRRLTELNPQIKDFAWGSAELVSWQSTDGRPLQGVLIKPGNYKEGRRYPVLIYYYRFFSQRLHEFNQMKVNHRPNFPFYASNGYCVFLPDVRFDVGLPGPAATKCLVPGTQKLIDMGIADPHAICLHGHSWSGYQTAFVVTQTNLFTCAIAGAPVSNMTSAYGGIRYGTGMARQFQYEQSQSRIGKTLWNGLNLYIENSPLFFADRIQTPLLLMSGDEDGAVPWTQSIEFYLALRRLDKPCVFLQYRGEPHHPQQYANKLDYTLKFKAFVDHFCKGAPAPKWWAEGAVYQGK